MGVTMAVIKRTAQIHRVSSLLAFQREHRLALAKKRLRGLNVLEHVVATPVQARIDAGRWLIDCECSAGNAADPDWPEARCFGCGAVHTNVVFPPDVQALEDALLEAAAREQYWTPGESLKQIEDRITEDLPVLDDKERE